MATRKSKKTLEVEPTEIETVEVPPEDLEELEHDLEAVDIDAVDLSPGHNSDVAKPKKVVKAKRDRATSTKGHYVTNAELIAAITEDKKTGILSNRLAKMLMMIAERYSYKPSWAGYSYREDMVAFAVTNLVANWHKFDLTRPNPNPFSFYTTAVYRSFLQYHADATDQRKLRDKLLIAAGANPSFSYQDRYSSRGMSSDDTAFTGSGGGAE